MFLRLFFVYALLAKSFAYYENRSENSFAFYENSNVIELFPSNFNELVLESDQIWVVQFYAPWCYYSKLIVSEYKKLATVLKYKDVHVGAMNAHGGDPFYYELNLKGFPTIKVYGRDKSLPIYYKGKRTAKDIENFVDELITLGEDEPRTEYAWSSMQYLKMNDNNTDDPLYFDSRSASEKNSKKLLAYSIFTVFITQNYLFHNFH